VFRDVKDKDDDELLFSVNLNNIWRLLIRVEVDYIIEEVFI